MEKELFQIDGRIFIINAKDGIERNLEKVLNSYFRGCNESKQRDMRFVRLEGKLQ
jgi:hypothetical protein